MADRTLTDIYTFDANNGIILPADMGEIEAIVRNDIRDALGGNLSDDPSTPIGRMMEWLALHFTNALYLNVQNSNQMLLRAAVGQQLDAIAEWFGLERKPASKTTVNAVLTGTAGAVIPAGSRAKNIDGNLFELTADATIGTSGSVKVLFQAVETGPVSCREGELVYIDSPVVGWDTVSNPANVGGTSIGRLIETDDDLRLRIENDRYSAPGFLGAVKNAIEGIEGIKSSMVLENNTGASLDVKGTPMAPHSVFVCVDGIISEGENRNDIAIAQAVLDNIPCGTAFTRFSVQTNEVSVNLTDDYGNNHNVFIYKPENSDVNIKLNVRKRGYTGKDLAADIRNTIMEWYNTVTYAIGETVYGSDLIQAVESMLQGVVVIDAYVSVGGIEVGNQSFVEMPGYQKAVFKAANITVVEV